MKNKPPVVLLKLKKRISDNRILILFVFISAPIQQGFTQSVKDILNHYYDTVSNGDFNRWNQIKTLYRESEDYYDEPKEITSTLSSSSNSKRPKLTKLYRVWPDLSMSEVITDSVIELRLYHVKGKHLLVFRNGTTVETNPGPFEPYYQFEPVIVKKTFDKSHSVKLLGVKTIDDTEFFDVEMKTRNLIWHFYFNTSTFILEYWNNSTDNDTGTLTRLYNYKKFGNLLIPMSELKIRNSFIFFSSSVKKLLLNEPIPMRQFQIKN